MGSTSRHRFSNVRLVSECHAAVGGGIRRGILLQVIDRLGVRGLISGLKIKCDGLDEASPRPGERKRIRADRAPKLNGLAAAPEGEVDRASLYGTCEVVGTGPHAIKGRDGANPLSCGRAATFGPRHVNHLVTVGVYPTGRGGWCGRRGVRDIRANLDGS